MFLTFQTSATTAPIRNHFCYRLDNAFIKVLATVSIWLKIRDFLDKRNVHSLFCQVFYLIVRCGSQRMALYLPPPVAHNEQLLIAKDYS
jgi:hypothetical protein